MVGTGLPPPGRRASRRGSCEHGNRRPVAQGGWRPRPYSSSRQNSRQRRPSGWSASRSCSARWHPLQSAVRFSGASLPRSWSRWWTSRRPGLPHLAHLHPSRSRMRRRISAHVRPRVRARVTPRCRRASSAASSATAPRGRPRRARAPAPKPGPSGIAAAGQPPPPPPAARCPSRPRPPVTRRSPCATTRAAAPLPVN